MKEAVNVLATGLSNEMTSYYDFTSNIFSCTETVIFQWEVNIISGFLLFKRQQMFHSSFFKMKKFSWN